MPLRAGFSIAGMVQHKRKRAAATGATVRTAGQPAPETRVGREPRPAGKPLPDPATVGGRLIICRRQADLKAAEAARRIGIKQPSLGALESGDSKLPASDTLLNMRDKLGYNPDYVVRGTGMPLMPNFEEVAKEMALISIFRELKAPQKSSLINMAQSLRRAQGGGPSPNDPFERDLPDADH